MSCYIPEKMKSYFGHGGGGDSLQCRREFLAETRSTMYPFPEHISLLGPYMTFLTT
jgi:hypothetical protein